PITLHDTLPICLRTGEQQVGCDRRYTFTASGQAQAVSAGARYRNRRADRVTQDTFGFGAARADPRLIPDDLHADIADSQALISYPCHGLLNKRNARRSRVFRIVDADKRADIAETGGRENGIDDGVRGAVTIGMPGQAN